MSTNRITFKNKFGEPGFLFVRVAPNSGPVNYADGQWKDTASASDKTNIFHENNNAFNPAKMSSLLKSGGYRNPPFVGITPAERYNSPIVAIDVEDNKDVTLGFSETANIIALSSWFVPQRDLAGDAKLGKAGTIYEIAAKGPPPGYTLFEATFDENTVNADVSVIEGVSCAMYATVKNGDVGIVEIDFSPQSSSHLPANPWMRPPEYPSYAVTNNAFNNWYSSHPANTSIVRQNRCIDLEDFYSKQRYIVQVASAPNRYVILGDGPASRINPVDVNQPVATTNLFTDLIVAAAASNSAPKLSYINLSTAVAAPGVSWNPIYEHACRRFKAYETSLFASDTLNSKHTFNAWVESLNGRYFMNGYGWAFGEIRPRDMALGYRYPNGYIGEDLGIVRPFEYNLNWPDARDDTSLIFSISMSNRGQDASSLYAGGLAPCVNPLYGEMCAAAIVGDATYRPLVPRSSLANGFAPVPNDKRILFPYSVFSSQLFPDDPYWIDTNFTGTVGRHRKPNTNIDVELSPIVWLDSPVPFANLTPTPVIFVASGSVGERGDPKEFSIKCVSDTVDTTEVPLDYTSIDRIIIKTRIGADAFGPGRGLTLYSKEPLSFTGHQCSSSALPHGFGNDEYEFTDLFAGGFSVTSGQEVISGDEYSKLVFGAGKRIAFGTEQQKDGIYHFMVRAGDRYGNARHLVISLCIQKWRSPVEALSISVLGDEVVVNKPFFKSVFNIVFNATFSVEGNESENLISITDPDGILKSTINPSNNLTLTYANFNLNKLKSGENYLILNVLTDNVSGKSAEGYAPYPFVVVLVHTIIVSSDGTSSPNLTLAGPLTYNVISNESRPSVSLEATAREGIIINYTLNSNPHLSYDIDNLGKVTSTIVFSPTVEQIRRAALSSTPNRYTVTVRATAKAELKSTGTDSGPVSVTFIAAPELPLVEYSTDDIMYNPIATDGSTKLFFASDGTAPFIYFKASVDNASIDDLQCTIAGEVVSSTTDELSITRAQIGNPVGLQNAIIRAKASANGIESQKTFSMFITFVNLATVPTIVAPTILGISEATISINDTLPVVVYRLVAQNTNPQFKHRTTTVAITEAIIEGMIGADLSNFYVRKQLPDNNGEAFEIQRNPTQQFSENTATLIFTATTTDAITQQSVSSDPYTVELRFVSSNTHPTITGNTDVFYTNASASKLITVFTFTGAQITTDDTVIQPLSLLTLFNIEKVLVVPGSVVMTIYANGIIPPGTYMLSAQCAVGSVTTALPWVLHVDDTVPVLTIEIDPPEGISIKGDQMLPPNGVVVTTKAPPNDVIAEIKTISQENSSLNTIRNPDTNVFSFVFSPPTSGIRSGSMQVVALSSSNLRETANIPIVVFDQNSVPIAPAITVKDDLLPVINITNAPDGSLRFEPSSITFIASINFFDAVMDTFSVRSAPTNLSITTVTVSANEIRLTVTPTGLFTDITLYAYASFPSSSSKSVASIVLRSRMPSVTEALPPLIASDTTPAVIHFSNGVPTPRSVTFTASVVQLAATIKDFSAIGIPQEYVHIVPSSDGLTSKLTIRPIVDTGALRVIVTAKSRVPGIINDSKPAVRVLYITSDAQPDVSLNYKVIAAIIAICVVVAIAAFIAAYRIATVAV